MAEARRIEEEIVREGKTSNMHMREERGLAVDDSGVSVVGAVPDVSQPVRNWCTCQHLLKA
jgi:PAB1-binding protein PBP1